MIMVKAESQGLIQINTINHWRSKDEFIFIFLADKCSFSFHFKSLTFCNENSFDMIEVISKQAIRIKYANFEFNL